MRDKTAKFSVQELSDGKTVLSRGKDHFMTLPNKAQAEQVKKLVTDAQTSSVDPERLVFAFAKALGVECRVGF